MELLGIALLGNETWGDDILRWLATLAPVLVSITPLIACTFIQPSNMCHCLVGPH